MPAPRLRGGRASGAPRVASSSPSTNGSYIGIESRQTTMASAVRTCTSALTSWTTISTRPASPARAARRSGNALNGSVSRFIRSYHSGRSKPNVMSVDSMTSLAANDHRASYPTLSTAPPSRVTRAASTSASSGASRCESTNANALASKLSGANGMEAASAFTAGGRSSRSTRNMAKNRSAPTTSAPAASNAAVVAPVPAPISSTRLPTSGTRTDAMSASAMRR